jgi:glycosyltransferase involved in cell wall biosynthesis
MRFCVDAHAIGCQLTGNEVYVRNLLSGFAAIDDGSEIIAYVSSDEAAGAVPAGFPTRKISRNPFIRLGYDLSRRLRQDRPDLVHVQYTAPLGCPAPILVSVHDVSFIEHPEYFSRTRAAQLRLTVGRTVARAARVLTGSEFSRQAIARCYGLELERISVVPNAAASLFRPVSRPAAAAWVRANFGLSAPFILTVGDLQPRKNQIGLIEAFARMAGAAPQLPHHLVLAGQETWHASEVRRAAARSGLSSRIHFTGFVSDDALLQFYNACEFFVFPSFYEGFGLPVLEAMACARAVACSNTSAIHDVADGAAVLFDPHSADALARALLDLALQPDVRARVERLGLQRAAQFGWNETARRTLAVYRDVVRAGAQPASERVASASVSHL